MVCWSRGVDDLEDLILEISVLPDLIKMIVNYRMQFEKAGENWHYKKDIYSVRAYPKLSGDKTRLCMREISVQVLSSSLNLPVAEVFWQEGYSHFIEHLKREVESLRKIGFKLDCVGFDIPLRKFVAF
jgi:hypothetical protein